MGENEATLLGVLIFFASIIIFTAVIVRFKLKNKELEMRVGDAELGPVVDALRDDINDTRAQFTDMQERLDLAERLLTAGRASQEDRSG